ncbi:MAG: PQQ-binding-like beta-propeller repeat protein [Phycisphaerae bacterium]|nr:PQQ-binding-like beta-propeller repeat protein [Phycisphaerae bacterium]
MHSFLLIVLLVSAVAMQDDASPRGDSSPTSTAADSSANGNASYVNSSFEADEQIRKARARADEGDWTAAAVAMQEIISRHGRQVSRIDRDRFVGIPRLVQFEISQWPDAGLRAYRLAFEKAARLDLEAVATQRDPIRVLEVAERFFCTESGAAAMDRAVELAMESGDFEAARQWMEDLVQHHPDRAQRGLEWTTKLAVCDAWLGDLSRLKAIVSSQAAEPDTMRVNWGGRERSIRAFASDMAADLKEQAGLGARGEPFGTSAAFCGGADRLAWFSTQAVPEAALWRCNLYDTQAGVEHTVFDLLKGGDSGLQSRSVQSGRLLSAMPVGGGGRVFVSGTGSVWAIDPERPQRPVWRFDLSGAPRSNSGWMSEDEPPELHTLLYAGGRVYAALDREANESAGEETPRRSSCLVCLDARTGTELWRNDFASQATRFEELSLDGAPILHRGRLYTLARKRKGFGFESCHLFCIHPESGRLDWALHVGEAATGSYGYTHPTCSLPAASGDRIYVHSNLGTVAAVSASTGGTIWLATYRSRYADETEATWPTRLGQPIRSWQYQPTMVWRGNVVCMPMDLDEILMLDAADGHVKRRLPMDRLFNAQSLLGIRGNLLYAAGAQLVAYDLDRDEIAWQRPISEGRPFGRGVVTSAGIFVPTAQAVIAYSLDGQSESVHPWPIEHAGNLVPIDDVIVVASSSGLSGLMSRTGAFARLEARMKTGPNDVAPALAMAELAFESRDDDRGLDAARESVQRCLADESPDRPSRRDDEAALARSRLFARLLTLAESVANRTGRQGDDAKTAASNAATAVHLVELAGRCAAAPAEDVIARLLLARWRWTLGEPSEAIDLYQSLLSRPELRELRVPMRRAWCPPLDNGESIDAEQETTIKLIAEEWIDLAISKFGRPAYSGVESAARATLDKLNDAGESTPDAESYLRIASEYPNSAAACDALFHAARLSASKHDAEAAVRSLRLGLSRDLSPDPFRGAVASARVSNLQLLVDQLSAMGDVTEARRWRERCTRWHPELNWSESRTGADPAPNFHANARQQGDGIAASEFPSPSFPARIGYRRLSSERVSVLGSGEMDARAVPWDAVLTFAASKIEARQASTGRSIWPRAFACPTLPILLGHDPALLYFAGAHSLFALTRTSGNVAWQFGVESDDDPMIDPEALPTWTDHVVLADRVISASDRGELVCVQLADGQVRWRRALEGGTASHLAADQRLVYCAKWRGRHNVIHLLDAGTGEPRGEFQCDDSRPIQMLRPIGDGRLLILLARSAMCVDPARGEVFWSVATSRHYLVSTFLADVDGFILSDDGRSVFKRDYQSGRLLWRSSLIGADERDGLWTSFADGRVLIGARDGLTALDSADGRLLWSTNAPLVMRWQSPIVTADSVLTVTPVERKRDGQPPFSRDDHEKSVQFRIDRFLLSDGRAAAATADGPLITEPLTSFGGVFVRDGAIIVLDGDRLIGYVGGDG